MRRVRTPTPRLPVAARRRDRCTSRRSPNSSRRSRWASPGRSVSPPVGTTTSGRSASCRRSPSLARMLLSRMFSPRSWAPPGPHRTRSLITAAPGERLPRSGQFAQIGLAGRPPLPRGARCSSIGSSAGNPDAPDAHTFPIRHRRLATTAAPCRQGGRLACAVNRRGRVSEGRPSLLPRGRRPSDLRATRSALECRPRIPPWG